MPKVRQIQESLARRIEEKRGDGEFRLPPERELAQTLGCSRATVGRALAILEGEGSIIRKKGSGTFIAGGTGAPAVNIALVMRNAYQQHDLHFRLIVDEIQNFACENNIYVQIFDRVQDMFRQAPEQNALLKAVRGGAVQGVLVSSRMPLSIISRISELCPAVSINNIFGDGSEVPGVSCDYFRAGFLAGCHLLANGHRRMAYLTESREHPEAVFDFSGFRSALETAGVAIGETDILETKQNPEIFQQNVIDFFRGSDYTACLMRSSNYVVRLIPALQKIGMTVPGDLSIISTGDPRNTKELTVIDTRLREMCRKGMDILMEAIASGKPKGGLVLLNPELIVKKSVKNLNKQ